MMYASTKDFFKSHLDGLSLEFQASDRDEVGEQVGRRGGGVRRGVVFGRKWGEQVGGSVKVEEQVEGRRGARGGWEKQ